MNNFKKILGYVWMLLAIGVILFLVYEAQMKITTATDTVKSNVVLQWAIILIIFTPISVGFFIFGKYATEHAYDHLPESSDELED